MNAQLHPVMQAALRGLCAPAEVAPAPTLEDQLRTARAEIARLTARLDRLVPSPFLIEVESPAVTHLAPENCEPASYIEREADESVVDEAIAWLVEQYERELSRKVAKLQKLADLKGVQ